MISTAYLRTVNMKPVATSSYRDDGVAGHVGFNALVGFIVGLAGGLVGLGGAELRLPYLAGTLRLSLKKAIPVNLAVSLATLLAALPTRLYALRTASFAPFLYETTALGFGAVFGAGSGLAETSLRCSIKTSGIRITARARPGHDRGVDSFVCSARPVVLYDASQNYIGPAFRICDRRDQWTSTVLTGFVRHYRAGALNDREIVTRLILPMGLGAIAGGIGGRLLASLAPSGFLKAVLGVILIVSSFKVFARAGLRTIPQ